MSVTVEKNGTRIVIEQPPLDRVIAAASDRTMRGLPKGYQSHVQESRAIKREVDQQFAELGGVIADPDGRGRQEAFNNVRSLVDRKHAVAKDLLAHDVTALEASDRMRQLDEQGGAMQSTLESVDGERRRLAEQLRDIDGRSNQMQDEMRSIAAEEEDCQRKFRESEAEKEQLIEAMRRCLALQGQLSQRLGELNARRNTVENDFSTAQQDGEEDSRNLADLDNKSKNLASSLDALFGEKMEYERLMRETQNNKEQLRSTLAQLDNDISRNASRVASPGGPPGREERGGGAMRGYDTYTTAPAPIIRPPAYQAAQPGASRDYGATAGRSVRFPPPERAAPPADTRAAAMRPSTAPGGTRSYGVVNEKPGTAIPRSTYQIDFTKRRDTYSNNYY